MCALYWNSGRLGEWLQHQKSQTCYFRATVAPQCHDSQCGTFEEARQLANSFSCHRKMCLRVFVSWLTWLTFILSATPLPSHLSGCRHHRTRPVWVLHPPRYEWRHTPTSADVCQTHTHMQADTCMFGEDIVLKANRRELRRRGNMSRWRGKRRTASLHSWILKMTCDYFRQALMNSFAAENIVFSYSKYFCLKLKHFKTWMCLLLHRFS